MPSMLRRFAATLPELLPAAPCRYQVSHGSHVAAPQDEPPRAPAVRCVRSPKPSPSDPASRFLPPRHARSQSSAEFASRFLLRAAVSPHPARSRPARLRLLPQELLRTPPRHGHIHRPSPPRKPSLRCQRISQPCGSSGTMRKAKLPPTSAASPFVSQCRESPLQDYNSPVWALEVTLGLTPTGLT